MGISQKKIFVITRNGIMTALCTIIKYAIMAKEIKTRHLLNVLTNYGCERSAMKQERPSHKLNNTLLIASKLWFHRHLLFRVPNNGMINTSHINNPTYYRHFHFQFRPIPHMFPFESVFNSNSNSKLLLFLLQREFWWRLTERCRENNKMSNSWTGWRDCVRLASCCRHWLFIYEVNHE